MLKLIVKKVLKINFVMIVDTFKQVFRNGETFFIYVGTGTMLSRQCVTTGYRNKSCYIIRRDISRLVHFATAVPGQLRAFLPPQDLTPYPPLGLI